MIENKTINTIKLSVYSFIIFIYFCVFLKKVDRIVDKKTWQHKLPSDNRKKTKTFCT
nr:MAG TPA: CCSMST1 family protein [Caudoviricetes sp.]